MYICSWVQHISRVCFKTERETVASCTCCFALLLLLPAVILLCCNSAQDSSILKRAPTRWPGSVGCRPR
jgi:hypothetical protein